MPLRETTFISRNVENWRKLEAELAKPAPDPDVLRDLYAGASDDLSYARTHYPNRSVRNYLNQKAVDLSLSLYRTDRTGSGFRRFWTDTIPLEIYEQRIPLLLSAAVFLLAFVIGWGSGSIDADFSSLILGTEYVEMTKENIAQGDPMAVYKDGSRLGSSLGIAGNNLRVALLSFVAGLLAGIGTLLVLLYNGIMVGAFQQFFFAQGVGWESVLGIWTHGTIEIASIIIAAGSGLVLAKGLLWPGTLSRSRAFQLTALSGLRILVGTMPLILLAALIEGYLTRMTELPTVLRVVFLLVNLAFVIAYFIVRPLQIGRRVVREEADYAKLPVEQPLRWREFEIRKTSEGFFDTLRFMFGEGVWAIFTTIAVAFPLAAAWVLLHARGASEAYYQDLEGIGLNSESLFQGASSTAILLLFVVGIASLSLLIYKLHQSLPGDVRTPSGKWAVIVGLAIPWLILAGALYLHMFLPFVLAPWAFLWMRGTSYSGGNVILGFREAFSFGGAKFSSVLGLFFLLLVSQLLVSVGLSLLYANFVLPFILLNFSESVQAAYGLDSLFRLWKDLTLLLIFALYWAQAFGLLYHRLRENKLAEGLQLRLEKVFAA